MDQNLKTKIEEFILLKEKENDKFFAWFRNIIGMAIALLGILVSFRSSEQMAYIPHLIFSISISLITLGIISGVIILFVEIRWLRNELEIKVKWINRLILGSKDKFEIENIPTPWYFKLLKSICYLSFILSLISLSIFTFMR